jgi:microcystin-dependent protein
MAQSVFSSINPATTSGTQLATLLNDFKNAVMSGLSGTSRPSQTTTGGAWIDTTNEGSPNFFWSYKIYDGTTDIEVFRVNLATGKASIAGSDSEFEVSKISADAAGPLLKFVKQRIASSGQVNSGDTIGEIRFVGRASDASNPTVAWIRVIAQENQTASAAGSYLSFASTAAGTASAAEFMRIFNNRLGIGTQAPETTVHVVSASGIKSEASSDDAVGGKLIAEKSRISGSGAVQSADVIGEVQFSAKDSTGAKSVTADIEASASEGHTASAKGTTLRFLTANTGSATLTEKLSIGDSIESVAAHRLNAVELVAQAVATTATINQLSATKTIVEFTGSTLTSLRGINSAQASKVVLLHNRSSADVTLEHENSGAVAADRLSLPNDVFLTLRPRTSIELYYSTTESRWKLKSGSGSGTGSGGGSKNYLGTVNNVNGNGDFEFGATTGWSLGVTGALTNGLPTATPTFGSGASGNLSISAVNTNVLAGAWSLSYASTAATTVGNMVASNAFTIDSADQAKVLTVRFSYRAQTNPGNANWSGTSANSFSWAIRDITNGTWIIPAGAFGMTQSSGVGIATGTFQTSANGTQYRLVVYNSAATTGAVTVYFDDFFVGPQTAPQVQFGVVGQIIATGSLTPPTGFLYANGAAVSRSLYSDLFSAIGTSYGVGDGSTTFNLPDLRGVFASGAGSQTISGTSYTRTLGAAQTDQLQGHAHSVANSNGAILSTMGGATGFAGFNVTNIGYTATGLSGQLLMNAAYGTDGSNGTPRTGAETRPANVAVAYHIQFLKTFQMSNDTDTRVVSFNGVNSSQVLTASVTNIAATAVKDTHGAWNGTQYIIPVAGDYVVSVAGVNSANSAFQAYLNGVGNNFISGGGATLAAGGSILIPSLRPGDVLSVRANASVTLTSSNLSIFRLSGPSTIAATESVNASYSNTAGTAITTSYTAMPFATRLFDSHNAFVTNTFTARGSGKYRISANLVTASTTLSTGQVLGMRAVQAGSASVTRLLSLTYGNGGTNQWAVGGSTLFNLAAGDTLVIQALCNVATSLALDATANHFSIERVGN